MTDLAPWLPMTQFVGGACHNSKAVTVYQSDPLIVLTLLIIVTLHIDNGEICNAEFYHLMILYWF